MKKIFASLLTVVTLSAVATGLALSADEKDVSSEYTVIRLSADDTDKDSESKSADSEPGVVNLGPTEEPSGQIYVDPTNNGNVQGQYTEVYYEPGPAGRSVLRSQRRRRFDVDYFVDARGGGLQGYDHGYTALGALITEPLDEERLFFIDGRLNITNNSRLGTNLGFGYRKYHPNQDRTSSVSAWWDWDNGATKPRQQIGLSYSSISRYFRMNANGYAVMGNDLNTIYSTPQGDPFFQDSNIKQTLFQQNEIAYSGADIEFGGPMPLMGKYGVDWYAGSYYYSGGGEAAVGAKGRFNFQVNRDWEMGVTVASDDIFGTTAQINVELHLPDGKSGRWFRQRPIYDYLYQPTERNFRVNTRRLVALPTVDLLNIKDGTPLQVAHVDPSTTAAAPIDGDGTFENPFNSTRAYADGGLNPTPEEFDIILVRGGDGTGVNLDTGITIFERQRLLSQSVTHDFRFQRTPGGPTLSAMLPTTGTGLTPILSRTDINGPVVTITPTAIDHCELTEVSGFTIDGTPPAGALNVGISGMGISGYNINRNTFENVSRAVDITNDTNIDPERNFGLLVDNTVNGNGLLSDFGFNIINTNTGDLTETIGMFVSNNTVDNISGTGINIVSTDGADVVANDLTSTTQPLGIIDNTVTNSGTGIRLESNITGGASTITSDFQNNSATNGNDVAGSGFEFIATGTGAVTQFNSFTGNTADNNLGNGAYVEATNSGEVIFADLLGTFDTFNNNSFDGNGVDGFANVANTSGSITFANIGNPLNATSNSFDGNTGNGFSSLVTGPATFTITNPAVNNTFSGNGDNGFISTTTGAGAISMFQLGDPNSALGNTFSNNGATSLTGRGIALNVDTGGVLMTSGLFNNTIEMNTLDGVLLSVDGATSAADDFSILNNLVNANSGNGIAIDLNMTTNVNNLDISDNTITANGTIAVPADGININLVASTLDNTTIESNVIDANLDDGVNINIDDSEVTSLAFSTNTISNQVNGHGINILQTSMTNNTLEVDFLDNDILDNMMGAGINVELMGAIQTTNVLGNTITGNGLQGINELLDLDSMLTLTDVSGNTISNNGGIGLQITANDTSMFDLTVGTTDPNVFDANTDAGIGVELFGTSSGSISVVDTTVTNTTDDPGTTNFAGDGIGIRGNNGSLLTSVVIGDPAVRNVALNSNAGNGFFMMLQDDAIANVVTIDNIDALTNTLNGLAFERQGNSDFQDVDVLNSTISGNTLDGIDIMTVGGALTTSMFDITGNTLDANMVHGIDQFISGNSITNVNINNNMITNSGMSGINAEGDFFGQLTGTYDTNFIDMSGLHGIALLATRDTPDFGMATERNILLTIDNNMIMRSTMDGLNVVSNVRDAGTTADIEVDFTNNVLSLNMNNGATINANNRGEILFNTFNDNMILDSTNVGLSVVTNGEIDPIFVTNSSSITLTEVARNDILRSGGDGVFLNTTNPLTGPPSVSSVGFLTANFIDNDVSFNGANGFTLLNQFTSDMNVSIAGTNVVTGGANGIGANSRVSNNGGIGVLVENNAMSRFTDNDMTFAISNTAVVSNGLDATLTMDERHGIFLRVGTTGGFTSSDDPDIDLTFSRLEQVGMGGTFSADVQDNYLAGNGGIDFASESFVAGTDPTAASSNGASLFNLDPLAYLILNLTGNEGDSIDLTRAGATYNNADELKSNELLFNANNVAGGSAGETRVRNAQRLADNVTFDDHGRLVLSGVVDATPVPAENVAGDTTTFEGAGNGAFPNVATNPADNEEFFFASVFFTGGVNNGVRENIRNYTNDVFTTRRFTAGIPAIGDPFYVDVYNIAGIGTSTFRTTDADGLVNTGNAFANVISDFTTQIDIGPQTGVGANDSTVEGTNQTFTWGIGDIFGSAFQSNIP